MTIRISDITGTKEFKAATAKTHKITEKVIKSALTGLFSNIIISTPVNTGRLKGNWTASTRVGNDEIGIKDRGGRVTIGRMKSFINNAEITSPIAFYNNVPYAAIIETGTSKQAPAGMVAVNVANFSSDINKAILRHGDK